MHETGTGGSVGHLHRQGGTDMTLRLVQPEEGCQHTHTSGNTTWACTRKPHDDNEHRMVPVPKRNRT